MGRISLLKEVIKEVGDRLAVCLAGGFTILRILFDSITIEYGALNPPCAEGAPLPLWDAGAEIHDRENLKLSARQWMDPNTTKKNDKPPYQHTGKGPCKTEKRYPTNRRRKETEQATRKEKTGGGEVKDAICVTCV